ncbi:MAG TPA: prepilin peptidase [Caulobacteraceae bacterium]|jgi:prepilin peptidase CpaA|nr:prepilin peptidase [Caulobacteraceae bacterium]
MSSAAEITRWGVAALFTAVLAWAAISDVRQRRIPNWTVLAVVGLFVPWALAHPWTWDAWALGAGLLALLASFGLYAAGLIGAGDSKLFAACALLVGIGDLGWLALATAVAGGAIGLVSLVSRPTRALVMFNMRARGDFGRGVPYGVAIAAAAAALAWLAVLKLPIPHLLGQA